MEWSPQQDACLRGVRQWLADRKGGQIYRVFGYAGTGKTTLAKEIAAMVDGPVMYMTFTGKASLVLQKKGCAGASTIHSAIYKPKENESTGEVTFVLNRDSDVSFAKLVIVDEVGMVGQELGEDLCSFGARILVLGDPFQLPPINGEGYFTGRDPDVMLTEIHRQAADNPIIRMSMDIRDGRMLMPGAYGDSKVINRIELQQSDVLGADQVIVGTNRTRMSYNGRIRQLKKLDTEADRRQPVIGDRLVCLRNNRVKGLLNGSLWTPLVIKQGSKSKVKMRVVSLDDPVRFPPVDVETPIEYFGGTEKELDWYIRKFADEFTFGWALTCHKSQGSQWDHVFVCDESMVFREEGARWLYTAVTRAAERVTVMQL